MDTEGVGKEERPSAGEGGGVGGGVGLLRAAVEEQRCKGEGSARAPARDNERSVERQMLNGCAEGDDGSGSKLPGWSPLYLKPGLHYSRVRVVCGAAWTSGKCTAVICRAFPARLRFFSSSKHTCVYVLAP